MKTCIIWNNVYFVQDYSCFLRRIFSRHVNRCFSFKHRGGGGENSLAPLALPKWVAPVFCRVVNCTEVPVSHFRKIKDACPQMEKIKFLEVFFLTLSNKVEMCLCIWFVCLSVCPCFNSRKYFSNVLKLKHIIHIWHSMDHTENGICTTIGLSTETHTSFLIHYTLWRKNV